MQTSQIPSKFQMAFGANAAGGNIRAVPVTTSDPNAASESLGWPPSTMTPEGAGGVPPDGRDMNGLDNQLSAWALWYSIGGPITYDSVQQAAIGGYPKYSVVGSVTTPGTYWRSTTENNVTNPDTAGAGWAAWPGSISVPWSAPPPIGNTTPNSGAFTSLSAAGTAVVGALISHSTILGTGGADILMDGAINSLTDLQINGVGFTHTFGTNGFQQLPSGAIIQWGRFFSATGVNDAISFPHPFPSNCTLALDCGNDGTGALFAANGALNGGFDGFKCWTWKNGSPQSGVGVGWIAIGY